MSGSTKTIHRADHDGYTECGRLIEGSGLRTQPPDGSGDQVTCGTCLRQLREYCRSCEADVVCIRVETWDRFVNADRPTMENKSGAYLYRLHCPTCDRKMTSHPVHRSGHHRRRLEEKERLRQQREYRDAVDRNHRERREAEVSREEAERAEYGVLVRGCAACGADPGPWYHVSWHRSEFSFLGWVWCPEHAEIGRQTDLTLKAMFRSAAADVRAGLLERMGVPSHPVPGEGVHGEGVPGTGMPGETMPAEALR